MDGEKIPYVKGVSSSSYLAGGYFTDSGGSHNDNSHTLGSEVAPAGYTGGWYKGDSGVADATGLTCAGSSGCHGDQSVDDPYAAVNGGHHGSKSIGDDYRFLMGVGGTEADDYEKALNTGSAETTEAHNIYAAGTGGISGLCASCHSDFHGLANTSVDGVAGPWKRHPTDEAIPTTWEIYTDFTDQWTNDADAWRDHPLGFDGAESAGNAKVICISCHRAHGSAYNDNLRWDYDAMLAGTKTGDEGSTGVIYGCLGCHDKQR